MATINTSGVIPTSLTEYITLLNNVFTSVFGMSFNTNPETPQGQLIGLLAFSLSQVDNSIVDAIAGTVMSTAAGEQQDNIASNIGIERKEAVNTEVICQLTGVAGTVITAGAQAADLDNRVYSLKESVTIPAGLTVDGVMVAQIGGSLVADANTVTKIITSIAGWETINNAAAGIVGQSVETNSQFYRRYNISIPRNSRTQISSIRTALLEIEDVRQALVQDNDQDTPQTFKGVVIPAHSVSCYVLGGVNQDIFNAIGIKKPTGVPYNGNIVGTYDDSSTYTFLDVAFFRAIEIPISINLTIRLQNGFPSGGIDQIKQNIIDYFDGSFSDGSGSYFPAQQIAQNVFWSRLFTPINAVPKHEAVMLTIGRSGDPLASADIEILLSELATIALADIAITVIT